jgi:hypothetical protein
MRTHYGQRFGFSGEIRETVLRAAQAEGASPKLVNNVLDLALGHEVYDQGFAKFSRIVTGIQTGSKLTLAVIPNMSQSINTLVFGGFKNTMIGLTEALKGEHRSLILQNVALKESVISGVGRAFGEAHLPGAAGLVTNAVDRYAHGVLKYSGFSSVEKWNRILAGSTGHFMLRDTLAKATAGRLRGNALDVARRRMESLGVNLDEVVLKVRTQGDDYLSSKAFQEIEKIAMHKASTVTQFNPNALRRPTWWNSPMGRIMFQFKSFSLGQGRFIRDQIFAEAARGNMRPLAYFASVYPVAGEFIGDIKSIIRGKPRKEEGLERLWSDMMMVGGMGLVTDTYTSIRWGGLGNHLLGPTITDASQFATNLANRNAEGFVRQALNQPIFTATTRLAQAGFLTVEAMDDYLRDAPSEDTSSNAAVPIGVHRRIKKESR